MHPCILHVPDITCIIQPSATSPSMLHPIGNSEDPICPYLRGSPTFWRYEVFMRRAVSWIEELRCDKCNEASMTSWLGEEWRYPQVLHFNSSHASTLSPSRELHCRRKTYKNPSNDLKESRTYQFSVKQQLSIVSKCISYPLSQPWSPSSFLLHQWGCSVLTASCEVI